MGILDILDGNVEPNNTESNAAIDQSSSSEGTINPNDNSEGKANPTGGEGSEGKATETNSSTQNADEGEGNSESNAFELNDDVVVKYLQKKNADVKSLDDLFKPKEVQVEVNPFDDILDDYDRDYLKFKKETGLGRKEFEFVQQDLSKKSELDWAFEKVRKDNGLPLTDEEITTYLEKKLQIDLSELELDASDKIELNSFIKGYKEEVLGLQDKYKSTKRQVAPKPEMVTLQNGEQIEKSKYEQLQKQRENYINSLKEGVSSATTLEVGYEFDKDGEKQLSKFAYEFSEKDKHSMLSNASDVNGLIQKKFGTENGGLNHKELAVFIDKAVNFEKYMALAMNQARAEALEEKIATDNNEQFQRTNSSLGKTQTNTGKSILDLVPQN